MDYEMNLEAQYRQAQMRKLAHKLASNRSKKRVVRRLPRAYIVDGPKPDPIRVVRVTLNTYKVASYALLMGLALGTFILDFNEETLSQIRETLSGLAALPSHFLGRT